MSVGEQQAIADTQAGSRLGLDGPVGAPMLAAGALGLSVSEAPLWGWWLWAAGLIVWAGLAVRRAHAAIFALEDPAGPGSFRASGNGNFLWWCPWIVPAFAAAPNRTWAGALATGLVLVVIYALVLRRQRRRLSEPPLALPQNRIAWSGVAGVSAVSAWLIVPGSLGSNDATAGDVAEMLSYAVVGAVLAAYLPWMRRMADRESPLPHGGLRVVLGGLALSVTPSIGSLGLEPHRVVAVATVSVIAFVALLEPVRRSDHAAGQPSSQTIDLPSR